MAIPSPAPPRVRTRSPRVNRSKACPAISGPKPGLVRNRQLDAARTARVAERDLSGAVAKRVVNEIAEGLPDAERIRLEFEAPLHEDPDAAVMALGSVGEALPHALEHRPDSEGLPAHRQRALSGGGDDQEVLGKLSEVVALLDSGGERVANPRAVIARAQRALQFRLHHRDRA